MKRIKLLLLTLFFISFYWACEKENYVTKFKPAAAVRFAQDTVIVNLDNDENPVIEGEIASVLGLKSVSFFQISGKDTSLLEEVSSFTDVNKYSFTENIVYTATVKGLMIKTIDSRDQISIKTITIIVSLSPAPVIAFDAIDLSVNIGKGEKPAITGKITTKVGIKSVKYYTLAGTTANQVGSEVTSFTDNKNAAFSVIPDYSVIQSNFKVVATDRKDQVTEKNLLLTVINKPDNPPAITFPSNSLSVNLMIGESPAVEGTITSESNLTSVKYYLIEGVTETQVGAEITNFSNTKSFDINVTPTYTPATTGLKVIAQDDRNLTATSTLPIAITNEDSKLSVYKNLDIWTQADRTTKAFSFASVDGSLYSLPQGLPQTECTKIDFIMYCGSNAGTGFKLYAPGDDDANTIAGSNACSASTGSTLWKNVYKLATVGCTKGQACCSENLWVVRNATLFQKITMTQNEYLNATETTILAVTEATLATSTTSAFFIPPVGTTTPTIIYFKTVNGKKGIAMFTAVNDMNSKSNRVTFSVKVQK